MKENVDLNDFLLLDLAKDWKLNKTHLLNSI